MELTEKGKIRNARAHSTETFEKRLRTYGAGAGAVAAGLLALSPDAMAQIVVIPTHVSIGDNSEFPIDIQGTTEFTLVNRDVWDSTTGGCLIARLIANPASGGGVVGLRPGNQAAALRFGAVIGPGDQFEAREPLLAYAFGGGDCFFYGRAGGHFANTVNRFLGLKFELHGEVYYGWAGFSMVTASGAGGVTAVLTAYAYETVPNTPIYAGQTSDDDTAGEAPPQPATLGLLALGAPGLDIWRPRKRELAGVSSW